MISLFQETLLETTLDTSAPRLNILLVEDDLDTRANLSDILHLDGYAIEVAGSFAQAKLAADGQSFDVVILDRRLPDGNADDRLPELVQWLPKSEIIVVTGFAELDSTIAAFRHGVADYILKPINPDALRQSLNRIAQRHQMEGELQREQQFADLILQTAEAIVMVLDLEGNVIRFNPFFERLSGWSLSEVRGRDWFGIFVPPQDCDRIRDVFMETAEGIKTTNAVNPILTRGGKLRQVRWSNTSLKDQAGNTTSVLAVGIDITEMLAAQQRSLQSERLAAIGKTMAALAHESRNALQRIQAGLEMLELDLQDQQGKDQKETQKDLGSIRRATTDLQCVLEEVRSFAAPVLLHLETVDLQEIWQRAWRQLNPMKHHPGAKLIGPAGTPKVIIAVDVMRMEQTFRNLFENSLAACERSANSVKNSVKNSVAPEIKLVYRPTEGDTLSFAVSDNGPGFGNADHAELFEPFYTTKPTGTGLGLAIVARIIEAHRGTIVPESSSRGASFVITLPTHPSS